MSLTLKKTGHGQKTSAEEQGEEQEPGFKEPASPVAPQNMFEVTAELGQQILEEWIEAAAEDLKPEDQNLEEFEAKQGGSGFSGSRLHSFKRF